MVVEITSKLQNYVIISLYYNYIFKSYFYQIFNRIGKPLIKKNNKKKINEITNEVIRYNDISKDSFHTFLSFFHSFIQTMRNYKDATKKVIKFTIKTPSVQTIKTNMREFFISCSH